MAAPNGMNGAAIRFVWSRHSSRKEITVTIVTKDSAFFLSQGLRG